MAQHSKTPAPAGTGRRTQRERRSQAEQALLDAAATLFARRGVDQTSLAEVEELAGYSRGLVNHHFGSKAALVEQLARRAQSEFVESLGEFGDNDIETLVGVADVYLSAVERGMGYSTAFFVMWGAALPAEAALRSVFVHDDAQFRFGIESIVRTGQDNHTIAADVAPSAAAVALVGMLRGIATQFLIDPDHVHMAAARTTVSQFIRTTLAVLPKRVRTVKK
jgi:AcrR family transcriptional regulator